MCSENMDVPGNDNFVKYGLIFSALWIFLMSSLAFWGEDQSFFNLSPNEQGDFLSGVAAPLALGWLVLGYFQQGQELRLQAKELSNQTRELNRTVQQHKELVECQRLVSNCRCESSRSGFG